MTFKPAHYHYTKAFFISAQKKYLDQQEVAPVDATSFSSNLIFCSPDPIPIIIRFPDLPGTNSQGKELAEAISIPNSLLFRVAVLLYTFLGRLSSYLRQI